MASTRKSNPFKPIYAKCNAGNSVEKLNSLPAFPRYIDVELTNVCNFQCLMCPTGVGTVKRPKGFMAESVYARILEEAKVHSTPLRFIRWGEPTIHPDWIDYVRKAKEAGLMTHLNTNGSRLDDSSMSALVEMELDSLKFSFQGVDAQSYREMRNKDCFDDLISTIKAFHSITEEAIAPYVHVSTTITYESTQQVEAFKAAIHPFVDLVTVGRTVLDRIDVDKVQLSPENKKMLNHLKRQESVVKKHPECPEVFDKLSINWDGKVTACCGDYDELMVIGDLNKKSLAEIWISEKMHAYRELLANMQHDDIPLCRTCYDYHGLQTPGLQKV